LFYLSTASISVR